MEYIYVQYGYPAVPGQNTGLRLVNTDIGGFSTGTALYLANDMEVSVEGGDFICNKWGLVSNSGSSASISGDPYQTKFFYCTTAIETIWSSEGVVVDGSLIANCDRGVYAKDTSSLRIRNSIFHECYLYGIDAAWQSTPDLGDVTGWGPGMNTFVGDCGGRYKHVNAPFRDPAIGPVMAEMNYWGPGTPDSDCFSPGTVDYAPWLTNDPNEINPAEQVQVVLEGMSASAGQNYPNPFRHTTSIQYSVPAPGTRTVIRVFDVKGRLVRRLVDGPHDMGTHRIEWDGLDDNGRRVASGIYFCRIEVGDEFKETKKMILGR